MGFTNKEELQLRIGITAYYGFVCVLAVRRFASVLLGQVVISESSYLLVGLYAAFALAGFSLLRRFDDASDRIAAFLYGLFYTVKCAASLATTADRPIIRFVESGLILGGMVAVLVGLKRVLSHRQPDKIES